MSATLTQVVAVVIEDGGKFLLGKRSEHKVSAPGYWCPISGRIEREETEEEAVIRETFEETDLVVVPIRKLCESDTRDQTARLHWWLVRVVSGKAILKNDEHSELRWVSVSELSILSPTFPEDIAIYRDL